MHRYSFGFAGNTVRISYLIGMALPLNQDFRAAKNQRPTPVRPRNLNRLSSLKYAHIWLRSGRSFPFPANSPIDSSFREVERALHSLASIEYQDPRGKK